MSSLTALAICFSVSLLMSSLLLAALSPPLRGFVLKICPEPESIIFWHRFTTVMLFLSPLFVALTFGIPRAAVLNTLEIGDLVQRSLTSSLVGCFIATIGVGMWVSSLARRSMQASARGNAVS